ncbi:Dabb family protein [Novispirillum itersonii]|uniref:Quinol monooxygenase YgiN n=1 Tax=Novispirillum itersonii TaxID=189 RepID=A0A7W9ZH47_NOVIT|nr:Dabb family protein [Novispirillum itersonii]MBB6211372.1 quinol monooxygenase YgiN [Novispirillum itersonii]
MIRHIVLFSAKNQADVEVIRDGLSILRDIPGSHHFEVAYNSKRDGLSKEIDVIVYGEFDSYEALEAYKAHPLYEESIRRVRPLREIRMAVDFESAFAHSSLARETAA